MSIELLILTLILINPPIMLQLRSVNYNTYVTTLSDSLNIKVGLVSPVITWNGIIGAVSDGETKFEIERLYTLQFMVYNYGESLNAVRLELESMGYTVSEFYGITTENEIVRVLVVEKGLLKFIIMEKPDVLFLYNTPVENSFVVQNIHKETVNMSNVDVTVYRYGNTNYVVVNNPYSTPIMVTVEADTVVSKLVFSGKNVFKFSGFKAIYLWVNNKPVKINDVKVIEMPFEIIPAKAEFKPLSTVILRAPSFMDIERVKIVRMSDGQEVKFGYKSEGASWVITFSDVYSNSIFGKTFFEIRYEDSVVGFVTISPYLLIKSTRVEDNKVVIEFEKNYLSNIVGHKIEVSADTGKTVTLEKSQYTAEIGGVPRSIRITAQVEGVENVRDNSISVSYFGMPKVAYNGEIVNNYDFPIEVIVIDNNSYKLYELQPEEKLRVERGHIYINGEYLFTEEGKGNVAGVHADEKFFILMVVAVIAYYVYSRLKSSNNRTKKRLFNLRNAIISLHSEILHKHLEKRKEYSDLKFDPYLLVFDPQTKTYISIWAEIEKGAVVMTSATSDKSEVIFIDDVSTAYKLALVLKTYPSVKVVREMLPEKKPPTTTKPPSPQQKPDMMPLRKDDVFSI